METRKSYWRLFAEEVPSDLGISLTPEQVERLTDALEGAHENYGEATGMSVADRNWRAEEDRKLIQKGANAVLAHVEDCVSAIDNGPSRAFDAMSHNQRMAMHELFQTREFTRMKIAQAS